MTAPESHHHSEDSGQTLARQPQIWGAVPLRNPDFIGREQLLKRLRRRLVEPGLATAMLAEALCGMGSLGKSQTVAEYIYRHASEYGIVWWIQSKHFTTIRSSFVDLARRLGIETGHAETAVSVVLETLRSGVSDRRWILVFDDADHPDVVRPFLPTGPGHVVVTSRNAEWAGVARTLRIGLFTREESVALLRRRADGNISDDDADRLAEALGDLPLAVEQAGAWRARTGMPVVEYLDLLKVNTAELLRAGATGEYELPVAAAWNVPLNRLKEDSGSTLELLQVCTFFSSEPICYSSFIGVYEAPVSEALSETMDDGTKLNRAIGEISRYGLGKVDHGRNTIQLHRLVQVLLRDQLDRAQWENMRHTVHLILANGDPGNPKNSTYWPVYANLLAHAIDSRAFDCRDSRVRIFIANLERYLMDAGISHEATSLVAIGGQRSPDGVLAGRSSPALAEDILERRPGVSHVDNATQTICAVDIVGYGRTARTWMDYASLREGMYTSVKWAFEQARISWDDCYWENTGDGLLILAPETVPKGVFAGPLLNALPAALREHNKSRVKGEQLELRLVLHAGEITRDEHGPIGPAIIHARRLLDAEPLKKALANSPSPLAVIVSDWFYTEVVWQRHEYTPKAYRRAVVDVKETSGVGWIYVPSHDPTAESLARGDRDDGTAS